MSLVHSVRDRLRPLYVPLLDASPTFRILALLASPRMQRATSFVQDGYDQTWARHSEHLERTETLEQWLYLRGIDDLPFTNQLDGKLQRSSFDWARFQMDQVFRAIERHFPRARSITEYGCGIGRNLLRLKQRHPDWKAYGYELSAAGVDLARKAAQKFGVEVEYATLDYVNGAPADFVFPATDLAMTIFSLEQIPYANMIAVKNMLDRVRLGSIHLEPVSENYPLSYRGLLGRIYSNRVDYLKNFDAGVRSLKLKAVHKEVLSSAHNALMYPSLYTLER
jgi:SAM-dependent methyltransferase